MQSCKVEDWAPPDSGHTYGYDCSHCTKVCTQSPEYALRFLAPPLESWITPLLKGYPDNALESDSELCLTCAACA